MASTGTTAPTATAARHPRPGFSDDVSRVDGRLRPLVESLEAGLGRVAPTAVVHAVVEFLVFGVKQAWACLFGGLMLAAIILTGLWYPDGFVISRYDALFLFAVGVQITFLASGLERAGEAIVILMFHAVGTAMEVFKTGAGSWIYPEENFFRIGGVPMFSGFMYAAVGSYMARVIRTFDFRFTRYPDLRYTAVLAVAIYINFFTHHYVADVRNVLFLMTGALFLRTSVHHRVWRHRHHMPLLLGFVLVALFIWVAENIGTWQAAWLYPEQSDGWRPVSVSKLGAWFLLMIISWVLVTIIHRPSELDAETRAPTAAPRPSAEPDHPNRIGTVTTTSTINSHRAGADPDS